MREALLRGVADLDRETAIGEQFRQTLHLNLDDALDLREIERVEHDDVIDAIEELRSESPRQIFFGDVRRHDDHRVLEIDDASLRIGEPPIIENLQKDVEDFRRRFLDLVEQHH